MFCSRARNWIGLALDGALPPNRTVALARHLERCAGCRDYQEDLRLGQRLLVTTSPPLSEGFEWRLQLKLNRTLQEAARAAAAPWEAPAGAASAWWRGAAMAAAGGLAAIALLGFLVVPARRSEAPLQTAGPVMVVRQMLGPSAPSPAPHEPEPASVTATAGDPTRTSVSGQPRGWWAGRDGTGQAVDLQLPGAARSAGLLDRQAWSGSSLEDLRSIATLREQNRRLRDALAQSQREVVLLRSQVDTGRVERPAGGDGAQR